MSKHTMGGTTKHRTQRDTHKASLLGDCWACNGNAKQRHKLNCTLHLETSNERARADKKKTMPAPSATYFPWKWNISTCNGTKAQWQKRYEHTSKPIGGAMQNLTQLRLSNLQDWLNSRCPSKASHKETPYMILRAELRKKNIAPAPTLKNQKKITQKNILPAPIPK